MVSDQMQGIIAIALLCPEFSAIVPKGKRVRWGEISSVWDHALARDG